MKNNIKYLFAGLLGTAIGCGYGALCFKLYKKKDLNTALYEIHTCNDTQANVGESITISAYECMGQPLKQMVDVWTGGVTPPTRKQLFWNNVKSLPPLSYYYRITKIIRHLKEDWEDFKEWQEWMVTAEDEAIE